MAKWFPRSYAIVRDGTIERVTVKDSVQETAIILAHNEATGLNRVEPFDNSRFVIEESGDREEG